MVPEYCAVRVVFAALRRALADLPARSCAHFQPFRDADVFCRHSDGPSHDLSTASSSSASRSGARLRWDRGHPLVAGHGDGGGLRRVDPFLMFTRQDHSIEKMTAVWLLPIVAAEVTASSAGLLVPYLADSHAALRMLVLGYALWAYSVPLAMSILVILLLRLALHKLPHKDMAASGWLALGPIGTGELGLLLWARTLHERSRRQGLPGSAKSPPESGSSAVRCCGVMGRGGCCSRC